MADPTNFQFYPSNMDKKNINVYPYLLGIYFEQAGEQGEVKDESYRGTRRRKVSNFDIF